ncbi:hypothetical protein POM88_008139 [Heracleum sosnowskyi]|uniref:Endonuclease/exonuclease/phosphatase domain-containing protein n=1 Tax=Heracleum sosnowskyi TaxID=360622 RepID=A0AAD8J8V6_9APIA|nr:hypothetical protein POM88_008139 [Heracleum sosnowskyi]
MNVLSWNCRGVGRPRNVQFLSDVVRQEKPGVVFLCETLAKKSKMEWVQLKIGYQGMFVVDPIGRSGGLTMFWKDNDKVEVLVGGSQYPNALIEGFNETLLDAGLTDMALVGHQFTWEKGRDTEDWMEVRLDRALTNMAWLNMFPLAKLYNLEGTPSDHSPILLIPQIIAHGNAQYRFKFENAWMMEPMCEFLEEGIKTLLNNTYYNFYYLLVF